MKFKKANTLDEMKRESQQECYTLPRSIFNDDYLNSNAISIYIALTMFDQEGCNTPTLKQISTVSRVKAMKTIRSSLELLQERGWIEVEDFKGKPSVYTITERGNK